MDAHSVTSAFERHFGAAPAITAASPGRINLIGEHTDYNDGYVLPASIDREAVCSVGRNDAGLFRLVALDLDGARVEVPAAGLAPHREQWANYLLGVADQLRRRGHAVPGLDCAFACDVPQGAGLSSSAAIECAFAKAVDALLGLGLSDWDLVLVGQGAENGFVGANTGFLDQFASVFGEPDTALLLDCRSRAVTKHAIDLPGHRLAVLNTGVKHNHVSSGYADRRADCERAVRQLRAAGWSGRNLRDATPGDLERHSGDLDEVALRRARFVVAESARVLTAAAQLERGDVAGFGASLLAGHWGLSELYEVSCPESDAVVRFAERHAACAGARQMGGGFGGCVLCVVAAGEVDDFVDAAQQEYFDRFAIALEVLEVRVGPGARVVG